MKKSTFTLLLVLIILGGYLFSSTKDVKSYLLFFLSKDKKILCEKVLSFLEDIKFKDFISAAKYHSLDDQKKVNIPVLIESLFHIKPEFLDIMDYKILETSLDSSGKRARIKAKSRIKVLNTSEIRTPEIIFYFHKVGDQWYMELESSLH
ncbi:MAG: hypothetical protein ACD_79C00249G0005 [uncultured bacterium]|nr:MAG: hypothetical protein ACD_79C00249G0005 [uncultured bacterium]